MGASAAVMPGSWMLRFVARRIPTCIALAAHTAVVFTLVYDPAVKLVIDEQPGPTFVEIVTVPPHGSTAAKQDEAAEPASTAPAELPLPTLAEESPPEISDRGEEAEKPVTLPVPNPKRAAVPKRSTPRVRLAARSAPPRTSEQLTDAAGTPDQLEGGAIGTTDLSQVPVDVLSAWKARLLSHLERYKRYPSAARKKGTEGTAYLSFGMDSEGRVLGYHLARSSGSSELDEEVLAMIVRASPLPPAPPEMNAQVKLIVPIRFRM